MSESFIEVQGTGKKLETSEFTNTAGETVHREAVYIGDPDDFDAQSAVLNQSPSRDAHGLVTRPILPSTAFGEVPIAEPTPVVQVLATYGLSEKVTQFTTNGGVISNGNRLFVATSGTDPLGLAAPLTRRQVAYRAGQGVDARWTAFFDENPVDNNVMHSGLITATDRIGFGYNGVDFGIIYEHGGLTEIQELTITTPSTGSENATITVDGTGYTVPLTAGTVQHNALEISESLNSQLSGNFSFSSNNDQVVARALLSGDKGSFAFLSATAAAAWSVVTEGLANTNDFIIKSEWNIKPNFSIDPTKGNVFQVKMQYLGFGALFFKIENEFTGIYETVHVIQYANNNILPSMSNPTFRVGLLSENRGSTTSTTLKGASFAGFVEGRSVPTTQTRAISNTVASVSTSAFQNIVSLRNRLVFGDLRNRAETQMLRISARSDSAKGAIIEIRANPDFGSDVTWNYLDKANSITEFASDGSPITGGRLIDSFIAPLNGALFDLKDLDEFLLGGETVSVSAKTNGGSAAEVFASFTIREDF